jgi:hypothetical protein
MSEMAHLFSIFARFSPSHASVAPFVQKVGGTHFMIYVYRQGFAE